MRVVTAPEPWSEGGPRLFLAGGISNCPDWQRQALKQLDDLAGGSDLMVLNPRRAQHTMPVAQAPEQIRWEFRALASSDAVLSWFPAETVCPIALYELGRHAALGTDLAVGCDPNYQRQLDVRVQLALARPEIRVHARLEDTVLDVLDRLGAASP